MKMKKRVYNNIRCGLVAVCLGLVAVACCHDDNDGENATGVHINLTWADPEDSVTEVDTLTQWIYDSEGNQVAAYTSSRQLATFRYDIPAGDYLTVTGVNVVSPFAMSYETRADGNVNNLFISLDEPSASPAHAYYSCAHFSYTGSELKQVDKQVNRVLAELSVIIDGAPEGAVLSTRVLNAADGIYPARQDADGKYGVASSGNLNVVTLKNATASSGKIATETMRLMPTVANNDYSYLHLAISLPDGGVNEYDAECPKMYPSGKYVVTLDYEDMLPFMSLSAIKINDWTEGWVINGVIFNPDE